MQSEEAVKQPAAKRFSVSGRRRCPLFRFSSWALLNDLTVIIFAYFIGQMLYPVPCPINCLPSIHQKRGLSICLSTTLMCGSAAAL